MIMIGIIPGVSKTFEIMGDFFSSDLKEGSLYYDPSDKRLFYYSKTITRSNPDTGFFPVWDGKKKYISSFSNKKYFDDSIQKVDIDTLCKSVNKEVADSVRYKQRRTDHQDILDPMIYNEDNMFTQTIKGTIKAMKVSIVDLIDMASPKLPANMVESFYNSLSKITLMRMDKWMIWLNNILHKGFIISIYRDTKFLLSYRYPEDAFDTGIVKYDSIISTNIDCLKKIIKIVIVMENINKAKLRSDTTDEYTINNLMTSLNGSKPLSAQLFSRFMRMAKLSYVVHIVNPDESVIFEFKDQ